MAASVGSPDPVARSSFRNVFGYALAAMGSGDEALQLTAEQLDDAGRCRLDFVIPYALTNQAIVLTLRREYAEAEAQLDEAAERARIQVMRQLTTLRGRHERGCTTLRPPSASSPPTRSPGSTG